MSVELFFLILGTVILAGFFGGLLFQRFRFPEVLILMGIGLLLGPVTHLVPVESFYAAAPFFGTLALILILFEGGLDLDFGHVVGEWKKAVVLSVSTFVLTVAGTAVLVYYLTPWDGFYGLLLGGALGCVSGTIVIPMVAKMSVSQETKTILSVESALADALAVLTVVLGIDFFHEAGGGQEILGSLFSAFTNSFFLATLVGLIWLRILPTLKGKPLSYMLTFAVLLLLYAAVEAVKGSGALAILLFGLLLSNGERLVSLYPKRFRRGLLKSDLILDDTLKWFHAEFSFLIRTFFFVYMGLIVRFENLTWDWLVLSGAIFLVILAGRAVTVGVVFWKEPQHKEKKLIWGMLPRGLTSAVLASYPLSRGMADTTPFLDITFLIIALTNIFLAFVLWGKTDQEKAREPER
ncbi:MAG: cation:proton antiporter [candidate division Zixibacteria bacterium]|nr:cation:proton antiporter [candidate division Zixibacteria bacterium]